jgi:hypothetical protein
MFEGRFCYSPGGNSWTDPISNTVSLAHLSSEEFPKLLRWGPTPVSLYADYMHEATHHACFVRPVGSMLAQQRLLGQLGASLLQMAPEAFEGGSFGDKLQDPEYLEWASQFADLPSLGMSRASSVAEAIHRNALREEIFINLLRPLAEGAALFCEFYAYRRRASIYSQMATGALSYFGADLNEDVRHGGARLLESASRPGLIEYVPGAEWMLRMLPPTSDYRLSDQAVERLAHVYSLPTSSWQGRAYLLGYLAVRRLFTVLSTRIERFGPDSDLFLQYLMDYFYSDFALAAFIVSNVAGRELIDVLTNHLVMRFGTLVNRVSDENVDAWEQHQVTARRTDGPEIQLSSGLVVPRQAALDNLVGRALLISQADLSRGMEFVDRSGREFAQMVRYWEEHDSDVGHGLSGSMSMRGLMRVGTIPIRIVVTDNGTYEVLYQGSVVLERPSPSNLAPTVGDGSLDVAFVVETGEELGAGRAFYVYLDDMLIDVFVVCAPEDEARLEDAVADHSYDVRAVQRFHNRTTVELDRLEQRYGQVPEVVDIRKACTRAAAALFTPLALWPLKREYHDELARKLSTGGILEVLGGDTDTLEALAIISLATSLVQSDDFIATALEKRGHQFSEVIRRLKRIQETSGLLLIAHTDKTVICYV